MKKLIAVSVFFLVFLNLHSVYHKIGGYFDSHHVSKIVFRDNIAYVLDELDGLLVIDVSDPDDSVLLGEYPDIDEPLDLALKDSILFVTNHDFYDSDELYLINVKEPTNPFLQNMIHTDNYWDWGFLGLQDSLLFIQTGELFNIYNISDPAEPVALGECDINNHYADFVISGEYAYLTTGYELIKIVDVSDPLAPEVISIFETEDDTQGLDVYENRLFLNVRNVGLLLLDVSDPLNIEMLDEFQINGDYRKIIYNNSIVYMLNKYYGVRAVSCIGLQRLEYLTEYDTPGDAMDMAIWEDKIFVADDAFGMHILDASDPIDLQLLYHASTSTREVHIYEDHLFKNGAGLDVYDISNPENPIFYDTGTGTQDAFDIADSLIIAVDYHGYTDSDLHVYSFEPPAEMNLLGECVLTINAVDVLHNRDKVYVAAMGDGIHIVDVSDPANPVLESTCDTGYWAQKIDYANMKLYVADGFPGLQIIDVSEPWAPYIIDQYYDITFASAVTVRDTLAFVTNYHNEVHVVDISSSTNPVQLAVIKPHEDSHIESDLLLIDNFLLIADKAWNEVLSYDISNPSNPVLNRSYRWNLPTVTMDANDECLVTGDQHQMAIHSLDCITKTEEQIIPASQALIYNYPNPFNPNTKISFSLTTRLRSNDGNYAGQAENTELCIYNIKGQKIKDLSPSLCHTEPVEVRGERTYAITWNGTDDNDQPVPSGVYYYALKNGSRVIAANKCLLLK